MTYSEIVNISYFGIFPFCFSIFILSRISIGLFLHTLHFYFINDTLATHGYWVQVPESTEFTIKTSHEHVCKLKTLLILTQILLHFGCSLPSRLSSWGLWGELLVQHWGKGRDWLVSSLKAELEGFHSGIIWLQIMSIFTQRLCFPKGPQLTQSAYIPGR